MQASHLRIGIPEIDGVGQLLMSEFVVHHNGGCGCYTRRYIYIFMYIYIYMYICMLYAYISIYIYIYVYVLRHKSSIYGLVPPGYLTLRWFYPAVH